MPVHVERHGPIATVTLDRPDALNAWDLDMIAEISTTVAEIEQDHLVRAAILTGAGHGFCAGIDLGTLHEALEDGRARDYLRDVTKHHHEATLTIVRGRTPWIAAINGAAAGGGMALALACDVRIAAPQARFVAGYLRVAVAPDGGTTWLLPRIVGHGTARDMLLLNRPVEAPRAEALGMVTEIVDEEHLMVRARECAEELAARPPEATAAAKRHLCAALDIEAQLEAERKATIASAETEEFHEGVTAFVERRTPRF